MLDDYAEVPLILKAIESRFLKKTVFVSGSAEDFGTWTRTEAQDFIHALSGRLIKNDYRVVNGFGWGVGSAVINGALEMVYANPGRHSEDQLLMRPFPQFPSKERDLETLWEEYRQRMISLAGVAIFLFGNKRDDTDQIVVANGMLRELEITLEQGRVPIPVGVTGYAAQQIWEQLAPRAKDVYRGMEWIIPMIEEICDEQVNRAQLVTKIIAILNHVGR